MAAYSKIGAVNSISISNKSIFEIPHELWDVLVALWNEDQRSKSEAQGDRTERAVSDGT